MFDLGFGEIFVIVIVAILVIGPEQMPKLLYKLGKWMRQLSYTRFALERQFVNFMTKQDASENPPQNAVKARAEEPPSDDAAR